MGGVYLLRMRKGANPSAELRVFTCTFHQKKSGSDEARERNHQPPVSRPMRERRLASCSDLVSASSTLWMISKPT